MKTSRRKSRRNKPRKKDATFNFESLECRKMMTGFAWAAPPMLAASSLAQSVQVQQQNLPGQDSVQRIVNGEQTSGYQAVGYVGPLGCTGTLISPTHVLTAAHCLEGVSNTAASFEVNGQTYNSSAVDLHPDYNANNFDVGNDLAIITLDRPVNGVTPMEINRSTPVVGTMLTLVGFGEGGTSTGGYDPNDTGKQVGQTELEGVTNHHITWNFDSHAEANTAPGDSGGPAFITVGGQQIIAGVTSGGSGDAHTLGDESFDTRVDVHAEWIDGIVGSTGGGTGGGGSTADDHTNTAGAGATKINLNANGVGAATGNLETTGDRDAFTFTVAQSGETTISLTGTSNDLDTYLRIYDSSGRLIHQNDDAGGALNSQVKTTLAAGKYFAVAGSYEDAGTGNFRLNIQHQASDPGGGSGGGDNSFSNNVSQAISENGRDRVVSQIIVRDVAGTLTDINVNVDIDHTYTSDLRLVLVAPDSTRVILVNRQGEDGNNFDSTTFDQDSRTHINHGDAPFRGSFRPVHSIDQLVGKNPNGRWRLVVHDFADGDGGRLNNWSIDIETNQSRQKVGNSVQFVTTPTTPQGQDQQEQNSDWRNTVDVPNNRLDLAFAGSETSGSQFESSAEIESGNCLVSDENSNDEAMVAAMDGLFSSNQLESLFTDWT